MTITPLALRRFNKRIISSCASLLFLMTTSTNAEVTLIKEIKIADNALHFDGKKDTHADVKDLTNQQRIDDTKYHYHFGSSISAHGDSVKVYKHYVFMTWYRGGKDDRHVMLSRLNTQTNEIATIEFPHRHTGYLGEWWIGESHNTIGLAVSPINGTIHMVYDMHGYDNGTKNGRFKDDYFRYSYSVPGTAEVSDDEFTLAKFVKDTSSISQGTDDYKHLSMTGDLADRDNFSNLTYPKFFTNTDGTLILNMRKGSSTNGAYVFNRYDAVNQKWSTFTHFNNNHQRNAGNDYNWGLYGNMKYVNGKLRVGFQQRTDIKDDRYLYQNGIYYAYSEAPDGFGDWYNHKGEPMTWPLINSDEIKIFEPGDLVTTQTTDKVYIVGNFDWTVTAKGDVHFVHRVKDNENNQDVFAHTYKPAGATEFITSTDFTGAEEIYTAGDNLYIIGLKNGNPYIEVAKGGTNEFNPVYQGTGGDYHHGVVYVHDGKVYYYLMKNQESGSARPIYLQIIDLGIPKASVTFDANEFNVANGYESLAITATPSVEDPNITIETVALYLDDELVSTLDAAPYEWSQTLDKLKNLAIGSYDLKAVVTDDSDKTAEAYATLNVIDPTPSISLNLSASSLTEGYQSLSVTAEAATPMADRTIKTIALFVDDMEVSTIEASSHEWTEVNEQLKALAVGSHSLKAVVTDNKGLSAEVITAFTVVADNTPPSVRFNQTAITKIQGYSEIVISASASTANVASTIDNISLYIDGNLVSTETNTSHQWTQTSSQLMNLSVGTHTAKVVATDTKGLTAETTITITVNAQSQPVDNGGSNSGSSGSGGGGGSTSPLLLLLLGLLILARNQVVPIKE